MTTKKHHTPEVIIRKLRKEKLCFMQESQFLKLADIETSDATYYKRRMEYG